MVPLSSHNEHSLILSLFNVIGVELLRKLGDGCINCLIDPVRILDCVERGGAYYVISIVESSISNDAPIVSRTLFDSIFFFKRKFHCLKFLFVQDKVVSESSIAWVICINVCRDYRLFANFLTCFELGECYEIVGTIVLKVAIFSDIKFIGSEEMSLSFIYYKQIDDWTLCYSFIRVNAYSVCHWCYLRARN